MKGEYTLLFLGQVYSLYCSLSILGERFNPKKTNMSILFIEVHQNDCKETWYFDSLCRDIDIDY